LPFSNDNWIGSVGVFGGRNGLAWYPAPRSFKTRGFLTHFNYLLSFLDIGEAIQSVVFLPDWSGGCGAADPIWRRPFERL